MASYIEQLVERVDDLSRLDVGEDIDDLAMLGDAFRVHQVADGVRLEGLSVGLLARLLLPLRVDDDVHAKRGLRLGLVQGMGAQSILQLLLLSGDETAEVGRGQLPGCPKAQFPQIARHLGRQIDDGKGGASRSIDVVGIAKLQKSKGARTTSRPGSRLLRAAASLQCGRSTTAHLPLTRI